MSISLYTFKYFFGVPAKTLAVYRADTSGPNRKPYPGTDVPADKRIDYLSHQEFLRALSGPGLAPTFRRFQRALKTSSDKLGHSREWTDVPDFRKAFQDIIGRPLIEAIYGTELLRLSPTFVDDLYEFDANVPWLAREPLLLQRIRAELHNRFGGHNVRNVKPEELLGLPLLQSVYAETLRLYTEIYIMVSSSQADVGLGRWRLPKDSIGLLNSSMSHRDARFWNTKDSLHPVDSFWADRFLIDPNDPSSGPINPAVREKLGIKMARQSRHTDGKPFFSTDGLEASWFPYGGGYSICPGRHLAKNVIILTCGILASEFDVEFLTDALRFDQWRFGLGMATPKNPLPCRIKRRQYL
ncbi:hypothetical protein Daus18300_014420 [Diaporthe australafricana]|uniref:Cytochrome P450 n=1 Tax=Diaporthe australafricana TaxID=127596 RepID=A0ABR3VVE1_9PEZI